VSTKRHTRWVTLTAALAFGWSACSDSTGPTGPFEPTQDAASLLQVEQDLAQNEALASMTLIGGAPPLSPAVSPLAIVRSAADPSASDLIRAQLSAWATQSRFALQEVIPDSLRGRTYVYNASTGAYEHDPARTDAPSTGIRFALYAVDPFTYAPVEPLNEIGYLDLIDQSTATTERLRVHAVVGTVTYVDYTISGYLSGSSVILDLVGYVTNGEQRVNFDIRAEIDFVGGDYAFDVVLDAVNRGVRVHLSADEMYNADTGEFEQLVLVYEVRTPRGTLRFGVTITQTTISGDVRWGGRVVVTIEGTIEGGQTSITFTKADGTPLTAEEEAALEDLFGGPDELFVFLNFVSAPLSFVE
jgi:hypothetical protein